MRREGLLYDPYMYIMWRRHVVYEIVATSYDTLATDEYRLIRSSYKLQAISSTTEASFCLQQDERNCEANSRSTNLGGGERGVGGRGGGVACPVAMK